MSIVPKDFESDHPPVRVIGTECEYNLQLDPRSPVSNSNFLDKYTLQAGGVKIQNKFLGEQHGAGKAYPDVGHLEFDTRESMGPASAAVEDLAGIEHISELIGATGYPYRGLYRLSGTFIPNGRVDGTMGRTSSGRTSGYHESYLFARYLEHSQAFEWLLPTALACMVWGRGGTLRNEGYVFSQKIWGNGGPPVEHSLNRRTDHGAKPMVTVPPSAYDNDTIGLGAWARAEVRMPDPGLSVVNRFLSFANVSLTLRLVEQRKRLNLTSRKMAVLCFLEPVQAAKVFAQDLTLRRAMPTISGRQQTALSAQESLLDLFEDMAIDVNLPEDELVAIQGIRSVVDSLRASNPAKAEYTGLARLRVEFAPKHIFVSNGRSQQVVNAASKVAMQRNLEWSRVLPDGPGLHYWQRVEAAGRDPMAARIRELARAAGVSQRSATRAAIVDNPNGREVISWATYKDRRRGVAYSLGSPAGD